MPLPPRRRIDRDAAEKLLERLAEARERARPDDADDAFQKACRARLTEDIRHRAEVLGSKTKVFVSYSGDVAQQFYNDAKIFLEGTGDYEVHDWRTNRPNREPGITKDIIQRIGACTCFLGIWVGRYQVDPTENGSSVPKVWMPVELGIARAKGAICSVLVHANVHPDFHREAKLGDHTERFDKENFQAQLARVSHDFQKALKKRDPRWCKTSPLDQDYSRWDDSEYWPTPKPDGPPPIT